jgi:hypothetical protein
MSPMIKTTIIKIAVFAVSAAATWCGPATAFAQSSQNDAGIVKVVKYCVDVVHSSGDGGFDAFYNPATGNVENNTLTVGEQSWLFIFNKCMAEQGFPLKY